MKRTLALLLAGTALALSLGVNAADAPAKPETQAAAAHVAPPKDEQSVTHGSVTINGKRIDYTATAGTIVLKNKAGSFHAPVPRRISRNLLAEHPPYGALQRGMRTV